MFLINWCHITQPNTSTALVFNVNTSQRLLSSFSRWITMKKLSKLHSIFQAVQLYHPNIYGRPLLLLSRLCDCHVKNEFFFLLSTHFKTEWIKTNQDKIVHVSSRKLIVSNATLEKVFIIFYFRPHSSHQNRKKNPANWRQITSFVNVSFIHFNLFFFCSFCRVQEEKQQLSSSNLFKWVVEMKREKTHSQTMMKTLKTLWEFNLPLNFLDEMRKFDVWW